VERVPTLKDVSAAIAAPIAMLGDVRESAGTHGISPGSDWYGVDELTRLNHALTEALAAQESVAALAVMLEHRRDGLARRREDTAGG